MTNLFDLSGRHADEKPQEGVNWSAGENWHWIDKGGGHCVDKRQSGYQEGTGIEPAAGHFNFRQ